MPEAPPLTTAIRSLSMPDNLVTRVSGRMRVVDPQLAAIAAQLPGPSNTDPHDTRARLRDLFTLGEGRPRRSWHDRVKVEPASLSGPDGNDVPARIYTP